MRLLLLIASIALMAACSSQPSPSPSLEATTLPPSVTPTETVRPTLTMFPYRTPRPPTDTPVPKTPTLTPTQFPTISPFEQGGGGFINGTKIDPNNLPPLPSGIAEIIHDKCLDEFDGANVKVLPQVAEHQTLCLYNLNIKVDETFEVVLTAPEGSVYLEKYSVSDGSGSLYASPQNGTSTVEISAGDLPVISIWLRFPPAIPSGKWYVTASNLDSGEWVEGYVTVELYKGYAVIDPGVSSSPFDIKWPIPISGSHAVVLGQGYEPHSSHQVGLYACNYIAPELGLKAAYAAMIETDDQGRFHLDFQFGPLTPLTKYYVAVDPHEDSIIAEFYSPAFQLKGTPFCQ